MNKFYITTSLPYINSKPHIGHALELVQADVIARWRRMQGEEVFFLTGTDEHGSKVAKIAQETGDSPQAVADRNSALFAELKDVLNLSNDGFIRTSDQDNHWPGAQQLWRLLGEAGDIYRSTYHGLYCIGCEAFVTEKDLVNGVCPIHRAAPEAVEEENYFFRLSKYGPEIARLIESGELTITPRGRATEMLNVIKAGLEDISFSRPAKKLPWGIPVPDDPTQTMYVWCDALANYITGIGYGRDERSFTKWWPADLHVIGKDILRFHAAIWPGMLLSAGLPLPKQIFVHGFISAGGHKMSKSLGNVIDPTEIVERYGTDALRYYLLREIPSVDDGNFSWQRFTEIYDSELANNLGNLLSRVLQMTHQYFGGRVPPGSAGDELKFDQHLVEFQSQLAAFDFAKAALALDAWISRLNTLIDQRQPWVLAKSQIKEDQTLLANTIYDLLEELRLAALLIYPLMPKTANLIYEHLGLDPISKGALNFKQAIHWGGLRAESKVKHPPILFPKSASQ